MRDENSENSLTDRPTAAKWADQLFRFFRPLDGADPRALLAAAVMIFQRYPEETVRAVCDPVDGLPSKLKWLPTPAEIKEACETAYEPIARRIEREQLYQRSMRQLAAPPRPTRPSVEELKTKYGPTYGINDHGVKREPTRNEALADLRARYGAELIDSIPDRKLQKGVNTAGDLAGRIMRNLSEAAE